MKSCTLTFPFLSLFFLTSIFSMEMSEENASRKRIFIFFTAAQNMSRDPKEELLDAIKKGKVDQIKPLMQKLAEPGKPTLFWPGFDCQGTPLMAAIRSQQLPVVRELLDYGVLTDEVDGKDWGFNAIKVAIQYHDFDAVKALLDKGASLDQATGWRQDTELMIAAEYRQLPIVKELLRRNVNVNKQNKEGKTALMEACHQGSLEVTKELLANGAQVNLTDKKGETALNYTLINIQWDYWQVFEELLNHGALIPESLRYAMYEHKTTRISQRVSEIFTERDQEKEKEFKRLKGVVAKQAQEIEELKRKLELQKS